MLRKSELEGLLIIALLKELKLRVSHISNDTLDGSKQKKMVQDTNEAEKQIIFVVIHSLEYIMGTTNEAADD